MYEFAIAKASKVPKLQGCRILFDLHKFFKAIFIRGKFMMNSIDTALKNLSQGTWNEILQQYS